MGMYLGLTTISQPNIDVVEGNPAFVWRLVEPDDPDAYLEAAELLSKRGFLDRLFGRKSQSVRSVPDPELEPGEGVDSEFDKAWHAIHFLLTGSAWQGEFPLAFLLVGGIVVPGIEVGYGPARILTPGDVATVDHTISSIPVDELCARFDGDEMDKADIYSNIWSRDEKADCLDYIRDNYEDLRACVKSAHERGFGLIVTIM